MSPQQSTTVYRKDYRPFSHEIISVELDFVLDPESTLVTSTLEVVPLAGSRTGDLVLDGRDLQFESLLIEGAPAQQDRYELAADKLIVHNITERKRITVVNRFSPAKNTALSGIYMSRGAFMSQCEAEGFRSITYWPDRPDVMSRFTVTMHADKTKYPVLLSNGNLAASGEEAENMHWARWEDPFKKPSYLFALVAGDFKARSETIELANGKKALLQVWTEPRNYENSAHALESLKKAIRWDEERFGLELDLERFMIVATDDFNFGAMENKGLNIFNSRYVMASPQIATDLDYEAIDSVVGHEYFHNWTGDRVTCRDWFQLTLKEGLTVFRDQEFSMDMKADPTSRAVKRIRDVRVLRTRQFAEDAGPMAHPIRPESYQEINNFYTMTVYEKGAEVIRMLQTILGRDGFRKGLDLYIQENDGRAVTCDDFISAMARANDRDLAHFSLWWSQAGTPRVAIETSWDEKEKRYTVRASQSTPPTPGQSRKFPLVIPVLVALLDKDGKNMPLKLAGSDEEAQSEALLLLENESDAWTFEDVNEMPVISIGRGFSAPVIFEYAYTHDELLFLATHDSDAFNRAEAFERLMIDVINEVADMIEAGEETDVHVSLLNAFEGILTNDSLSAEYRAAVLALPSEKAVSRRRALINPQAVHHAVRFVAETIGRRLSTALLTTINKNLTPLGYDPCALDAGKRALKNLALNYCLRGGNAKALLTARDQFDNTDNLTDRLAALNMIVNSLSPAKIDVLNAAGRLWKDEPLLINKWFTVQASAMSHADECPVLERVKSLMDCPVFSLNNPNNVYALLGAFFANEAEFHRPDGSGYRFWKEVVLKLDSINPHVAARMARSLDEWRHYAPELAQQMHRALKDVEAAENLSAGVREIVYKALNSN